jgi:EmrB/QacA subfamily drug resistance transporter
VTPPHQRGGMMGIYALPVMGAPILGPTLGGYLVEYVDWRWVFYMNLPPGILAIVLGALLLRETPTRPGLRFDLLGFVLAATCTGSALLGATEATELGWSDAGVVAKLAISAVTLPLFIWWELRVREPLMNLRLFAIPAFSLGALVNFVATAAMFGALFLLPVFLQDVRGLGALESGLLLLPQALAMAVTLVLGGRLYDLLGPRPLVVPGLLLLGLATWMLSGLDVNTSDDEIRAILFLRGAAIGMTMMPAITAWLASVPARETQAASALNNVLRQVFGAFSTAIFATILDDRITFHYASLATFVTPSSPGVIGVLARAPQLALEHGLSLAQAKALLIGRIAAEVDLAASVRAFDDCFLIAAITCVLGAIPSWFIRRPSSGAAPRA